MRRKRRKGGGGRRLLRTGCRILASLKYTQTRTLSKIESVLKIMLVTFAANFVNREDLRFGARISWVTISRSCTVIVIDVAFSGVT